MLPFSPQLIFVARGSEIKAQEALAAHAEEVLGAIDAGGLFLPLAS